MVRVERDQRCRVLWVRVDGSMETSADEVVGYSLAGSRMALATVVSDLDDGIATKREIWIR